MRAGEQLEEKEVGSDTYAAVTSWAVFFTLYLFIFTPARLIIVQPRSLRVRRHVALHERSMLVRTRPRYTLTTLCSFISRRTRSSRPFSVCYFSSARRLFFFVFTFTPARSVQLPAPRVWARSPQRAPCARPNPAAIYSSTTTRLYSE